MDREAAGLWGARAKNPAKNNLFPPLPHSFLSCPFPNLSCMGMYTLELESDHLVSNFFSVLASMGLYPAVGLIWFWLLDWDNTATSNCTGLQNGLNLMQITVEINIFMEPAAC